MQRLIVMDLEMFQVRDPAYPDFLRGRAAVTVRVYEAERAKPNYAVFIKHQDTGQVTENKLPGPNPKAETILGRILKDRLSLTVSWLFYDHIEWVER